MDFRSYVELYHILKAEKEYDDLLRTAVYLLISRCLSDPEISEEEAEALSEYAALDLGKLERTIH